MEQNISFVPFALLCRACHVHYKKRIKDNLQCLEILDGAKTIRPNQIAIVSGEGQMERFIMCNTERDYNEFLRGI